MKELLEKLALDLGRIRKGDESQYVDALSKFAETLPEGAVVLPPSVTSAGENRHLFESGKSDLTPQGQTFIRTELAQLKSFFETNDTDSIQITVYSGASRVPYSGPGGNTGLAERRSEGAVNFIKEYLPIINIPVEGSSPPVIVTSGLSPWFVGSDGKGSGPEYCPSDDAAIDEGCIANGGDQCDKHNECFKKHQLIYITYTATGASQGETEQEIDKICINLGGEQQELSVIKGWADGHSERKDKLEQFGGWTDGPCPDGNDDGGRGPTWYTIFKPWLDCCIHVCQLRDGSLLHENGVPWVGVSGSFAEALAQEDGQFYTGRGANLISLQELRAKCQGKTALLLKIWPTIPEPEPEEEDEDNTTTSPYCHDQALISEVEESLTIDMITEQLTDYIFEGDTFEAYIEKWESNVSTQRTQWMCYNFTPFDKEESNGLARNAYSFLREQQAFSDNAPDMNSLRNRDALRVVIKNFLDLEEGGGVLDKPLKQIRMNWIFNRSGGVATVATSCTGWDYIRWGGPCQYWGPGAVERIPKEGTGSRFADNPDTDVDESKVAYREILLTPNGPTGANAMLPNLSRPQVKLRILTWFLDQVGESVWAAGAIRGLGDRMKRPEDSRLASPCEQRDVSIQEANEYETGVTSGKWTGEQARLLNQSGADDGHIPSNKSLDEHFLKSRTARRARLRRIIKQK